jgi:hypothetical protein
MQELTTWKLHSFFLAAKHNAIQSSVCPTECQIYFSDCAPAAGISAANSLQGVSARPHGSSQITLYDGQHRRKGRSAAVACGRSCAGFPPPE